MKLLQAWNLHRSLSPQQRNFLREKKINLRIRRSEWFEFLGPVARLDRASNKLRPFLAWTVFIAVSCSIMAYMIAPPSLALLPSLVAIAALAARFKLSKIDLPDHLHEFVLPVFALLQEETTPRTEIALKLDLRGHATKDKVVSATGPKNDQTKVYRDPWMECELELHDGTQLRWEILDLVRTRHRIKTNPRGKTKHKHKSKIRRVIDVRLRAKSKDYALDAATDPSNDKIRLDVKEGEKRNLVRVRILPNLFVPGTTPYPGELVDAIAAAYAHFRTPLQPVDKK